MGREENGGTTLIFYALTNGEGEKKGVDFNILCPYQWGGGKRGVDFNILCPDQWGGKKMGVRL